MKSRFSTFVFLIVLLVLFQSESVSAQGVVKETVITEKLLYHPIHLNSEDQTILPWYSPDLGKSYDFVIGKVWNFWNNMRADKNGLPYYMNHQEIKETNSLYIEGWSWNPLAKGGVLAIRHLNGNKILVVGK